MPIRAIETLRFVRRKRTKSDWEIEEPALAARNIKRPIFSNSTLDRCSELCESCEAYDYKVRYLGENLGRNLSMVVDLAQRPRGNFGDLIIDHVISSAKEDVTLAAKHLSPFYLSCLTYVLSYFMVQLALSPLTC